MASRCEKVVPRTNGYDLFVASSFDENSGAYDTYGPAIRCEGYRISISVPAQIGTSVVHIPQSCVTTTDTCVGPLDPAVPSSADVATVCIDSWEWYQSWGDVQWGGWSRPDPTVDHCVPVQY